MNGKNEQSPFPSVEPLNLSLAMTHSDGVDYDIGVSAKSIKIHHPIQTPRSEMDGNIPLTHSVSSTIFEINQKLSFEEKPLLSNTPFGEDFNSLFQQKCRQCFQICNFSDTTHVSLIKQKETIMKDMLNAVGKASSVKLFSEAEYSVLYKCFSKNVIRAVPNPPHIWFAPVCIDFTLDRVEEIGWSHLSLMYDILFTFLTNPSFNPKICDSEALSVIRRSIPMFESPDVREREKLMSLYHAFYRAFRHFRSNARIFECSFLIKAQENPHCALGCLNLLTASVSIISGFKVPLQKEHVQYYKSVLLPLHHSSQIHMFHPALLSCIVAFLEKNPGLVDDAFDSLFLKWPLSNPTKEILYLQEIEVLSKYLIPDIASGIVLKISKCVKNCIANTNFAIAEKALTMWENDNFVRLIQTQANVAYPILLPTLFKTAQSHWFPDVKSLALLTMRILKSGNMEVFDLVGTKMKRTETDLVVSEMEKGLTWSSIAAKFSSSKTMQDRIDYQLSDIYIGCESLRKKSNKK